MSSAIVLNEKLENVGALALPASFEEIHSHNLYLYVKSYQAALRSNTAHSKTKGEVSGGGKKPWAQKGRGGARAGSRRSPVWVGGGAAFGPKANRNYDLKVNKKQKRLALEFALNEKAANNALFVVDSLNIESGKTKDAASIIKTLGTRDALIVKELVDEKTMLAFRNIQNCYLVDASELNAYLATAFYAVIIEKSVLETITKEG
ncbi:MAG: 50S ribosomal protein L4 [Sulfurospirillum sp.]|jgi:large subunit ribosomal protein L4|uniref:Large ribosomal subunit protein uL4 n=1 Tax=Sulfurospirillum deleyianum (strain ATCC 51133 / DSM 6946 / 5175) TaxID=525898 RepID=D1B4G2_SULD5|nr:50S ribosomal protein L4 [Sulfurospirillum deleyianum]ACZ12982.1 ribosomal protein L4/L1e [Sulfurospirillum deleyianum DSM 6946]MBP9565655.1 50S ribosomal protein L4 [Sulfurospirillum sp.]MCD8477166.1 50S ribosomal protein L4 [Sulfurospirillum sp.]NCD11910.1 50S ribosomal protein L4 [Campylobacterota bacterium]